jgi:hypothetical protein
VGANPLSTLFPQQAILLVQVLDRLSLLLIDPASNSGQEQSKGIQQQRHTLLEVLSGAGLPGACVAPPGNFPIYLRRTLRP